MTTGRKRVLSGMQPSGLLHLGNWLGALENWNELQEEYECFFFVADWHALSSNYADTSRIREFVRELLIDWLAAGIDPKRATVFVQSQVPDHAILHLLFSMIIPVSWLERNPTYKEKQAEIKERDLSTYGFLGYPVLQAADILLYRARFRAGRQRPTPPSRAHPRTRAPIQQPLSLRLSRPTGTSSPSSLKSWARTDANEQELRQCHQSVRYRTGRAAEAQDHDHRSGPRAPHRPG